MPYAYNDANGWILWTVENGQRYEHVSFNADFRCPADASHNGRGTGCVGAPSVEAAIIEANAWRDGNPTIYQQILTMGRSFVFYNYQQSETCDVLPFAQIPAPLTPDEELRKKKMIKLKFTRESGKLVLSVNATGLHETLDAIGCRTQTAGGVTRYESRPHAPTLVADTSGNTLSTEIFLVKPPEGKTETTYNLSEVYQRPPSLEQLRRLANSANEKARAILEHYQPVDIQVSIQKKLIG